MMRASVTVVRSFEVLDPSPELLQLLEEHASDLPLQAISCRYLKHSHLFQAAYRCRLAAPVLRAGALPASRFLRGRLPGGRPYAPSTGV
jgi:hypothetical protein